MFRSFFNSEKAGGLLLLFCTCLSLWIANAEWGHSYISFWHMKLDASFAGLHLNYSIEHWINDGLMTIFFLLVGLEIERELFQGELSNPRNALLPVGAAMGGMVVPALVYSLVNLSSENRAGVGIPMATDIAFALGVLSLAGKRVPFQLKIFLTALAIIDDLGAILVIALFYNTGLSWLYLLMAAGIFALLMVFNKTGVKNLFFYLIPGLVMWYCMIQSGIHATLSGVLLAIAIPFSKNDKTNPSYLLQHSLHKPVAFLILPLFALANTGIILPGDWSSHLLELNSLGIIAGLVLGKPVGILVFCWLMIRMKWLKLPPGIHWKGLTGIAILGGIGFTMSIFISNLAFTDSTLIQSSKIAVLFASLAASILGLLFFFLQQKQRS